MMFLSDADKMRIADAIRQVESRTSGEIMTVIARKADDYFYIPTLWAAMLALLLPGVVAIAGLHGSVLDSYEAQIILFLVSALVIRIPAIKYRLIPGAVKRQRAARLAREQFLMQNLHYTEGRTGVMLFVSVAERYVEIIADKGINDVVKPGTWDWVVAEFVARVKEGRIADGFVSAVEGCGEQLAQHFPVQANDRNELPNHLIEI